MACDVKLAMYRSVVITMIATFSGIRASTGLLLHLVAEGRRDLDASRWLARHLLCMGRESCRFVLA